MHQIYQRAASISNGSQLWLFLRIDIFLFFFFNAKTSYPLGKHPHSVFMPGKGDISQISKQ